MSRPWLTPAGARELAAEAERLAERIDGARADRNVDGDESRRRAGFRLEEVAGDLRRAARELLATAEDLARLASGPAGACPVPSGVCPEHGPTLTSSGGETWCTASGCRRRWGYDRLTMPCTEPVAFHVIDAEGATLDVCAGHAIEVRARMQGAVVTPLERSL